MEPEEELTGFQKLLLDTVTSLSFISRRSGKLFEKLQNKLNNNHELDVNMMEDVGIRIIDNLKTMKGNIAGILKSFEGSITDVNKNQNEPFFEQLSREVALWKTSVVSIDNNNQITFTQLCDKDTMVDESKLENNKARISPCTSDLDQTRSPQDSIIFVDSASEGSATIVGCSNNPNNLNKFHQGDTENSVDVWDDTLLSRITKNTSNDPTSNEKSPEDLVKHETLDEQSSTPRRNLGLSLKPEPDLSDTQNTDDDWNDTLRLSSHVEKVLEIPKEEEDDKFDMETLHLNQDQDDILDDSFLELKMEPSQSFELKDENICIESLPDSVTQKCSMITKANVANDSNLEEVEEKEKSSETNDQIEVASDTEMGSGTNTIIENNAGDKFIPIGNSTSERSDQNKASSAKSLEGKDNSDIDVIAGFVYKESDSRKKKEQDPSSTNTVEDANSSDDDLYDAPTQKISKEKNEIDLSVEDNNLFLHPTQKVRPKKAATTNEIMEDPVDALELDQDPILKPIEHVLDDETGSDSQNTKTTFVKKNDASPKSLDHTIRKDSKNKTSSEVPKKLDDTLDNEARDLLRSSDDETMINFDVEAVVSKTRNGTEAGEICKGVASSSKSDSGVAEADIYDNPPFSDETFKFDSDEEMDKSTGFWNEHSYSCASASDVEDSFKGNQKDNSGCKLNTEYIHNEHNYSSPGLLSDEENLIENDSDSDATDIDRVAKDNLSEISDSQEDYLVETNKILDSETESLVLSQESNISYEFDVTQNVNHIDNEENDNDAVTQRSSSRSSRIIVSDECDSNSSCASSRRIDDSDIEHFPIDEETEILTEDQVPNQSNQKDSDDSDSELVSNGMVDALVNKINTAEEESKQNSPVDSDKENASLEEVDELICQMATAFAESTQNNESDKNVSNKEEDASMSKIATADEEPKQNSPDKIAYENFSNEEVDTLLSKIVTEDELSKQKSSDEWESQHKDIQEASSKNNQESSDDDIIKELEDILSKKLETTIDTDTKDNDSNIKTIEATKQNDDPVITENEDTKDSLMDMTMEEILSDTEIVRKIDDSEETIIVDDIKIESDEPPEVQSVEENMDVGDEILSLLKEVKSPDNAEIEMNTDDDVEAEKILKMLQDDSSDESDSENTDDSSLLFSDSSSGVELVEKDDQSSLPDDEIAQILEEHDMVDCSVQLEKLKLSHDEIEKHKKQLEDNWEWLCDLTNLQNKRKHPSPVPFEQAKRHRRKHRVGKSSESSGSTGSSSGSDVEMSGYDATVLPQHLENKLDDILANSICKELRNDGNSSSEDSSDESDDTVTNKKAGKESNGDEVTSKGSSNDISKGALSKEELKKKAWKNNPLLRGRLSSHSESEESEASNSNKRRKKKREEQTEISIDSDKFDSDSDADVYKKNKSKLEEKEISPIKRNIPVSDTSDTDSDIEFVSQKMKTPVKEAADEFGPSPTQKGRRNIRALMSDETLAEATRKANKEEIERIERLKEREKVIETFSQSFTMSQSEELEVNPLFLDVDEKCKEPTIQVHDKITALLKDHQRIGIQFMWDSCYESVERLKKHDGSGCILAHCMGLGKTLQVLALIHTLFNYEVTNTKHVLVVCPLSTVSNWKKEVKWAFKGVPERTQFSVFTIATRKEASVKYEIVKKWHQRKKALLVLGYEGFETLTNESKLDKLSENLKTTMLHALMDPGPDLVICDEGHLLRNKKALKSQALNKIRTKRRIVLTGTPLQNNLCEYYHMVHTVKPNLLGNMKEFKTNFVNPITNGQYEDSTEDDIKLMMKRTHVLHRLLAKCVQRIEDSELELYLPKMADHAVFVQLTQAQIDLYNEFSAIVKRKTEHKYTKGFLSDFQIFQYICTHPHLLAVVDGQQKNRRIKERDLITNEDEIAVCDVEGWWKDRLPVDGDRKIGYGNKLVVVKAIIEECEEIGDKVLVFSQCLGELDLIEHFLKRDGTKKCASWQKKVDYYRMDGTVSPEDRSFICDKFNNPENSRIRLLLMSTKVGGLGLNLTAANRVIIMTVNWNPSYDTQSVFRVYRFGQQKAVYVYRLISMDTMEEKVYQRGVTKLAIARRVVDKQQITNHYQLQELQELYSCNPNADSERPTPNVPEDQVLAKLILRLPFIFKYHEHKALLANRPEINLSKEELASAWQAWKDSENAPKPAPPPIKAVPAVTPTPQTPIQTGPNFNQAYNLGRNNINILTNLSKNLPSKPTAEQLKQYFIPASNGIYRPQVVNLPNPFSAQRKPNVAQPSSSAQDPLHLPNNQPDKLSNRMWSYRSDQNKNIRLPAPTLNWKPGAKEATPRDDARTIRQVTPVAPVVPVGNRITVSAKSSNRVEPVANKAMPLILIPTSRVNENRLKQIRAVPVVTGTRGVHKAETPNLHVNPASNILPGTKIVKVRKSQHSSPKPTLAMVPSLRPSKFPENAIMRVNPASEISPSAKTLLVTPSSLTKLHKNTPKENTGPKTGNAPSPSIRGVAKRKSVETGDVAAKKPKATSRERTRPPRESKEKAAGQKAPSRMGEKEAAAKAASDPRSLPKELIKTLGQSGVTIRKLANVQDVITLD